MANHEEDHHYHPQDAISAAIKTTMMTGGIGLFASAVQNTLTRQNVGPLGVFMRSGGTITALAAMGGTYEFAKIASANLREKEDSLNTAIGGFFSGSILGLRVRSLPAVLGYGVALSAGMFAFDYTGGSLFGTSKDKDVDEFDRRTKLRKAFQTPGEQTVAELGEGRGIYGPNYEERRAERIKEAYGIDVPRSPVPAS
ncbi:NADH-ubiquinone oxidoreductase [Penicillium ucsense]|uniref:NADH-ubiquinone oxidoreductase n=2 Tax=Penicillium TaxID=5073 RepID=A0A8J8W459_9EURO|nr:NADH-ubiquinone oxidoreductase [Penicillium diatomitis]KAF7714965.1 NADH-ubiquinone oxidoreductase [Penicillium ucsense]KAF7736418.1 NADH-ubiquinone oxidoreductase [Penicillium ucsense]KAJ5482877.1 NADH-ubiquinone oxidoreductase [Penicillium diatomitis]